VWSASATRFISTTAPNRRPVLMLRTKCSRTEGTSSDPRTKINIFRNRRQETRPEGGVSMLASCRPSYISTIQKNVCKNHSGLRSNPILKWTLLLIQGGIVFSSQVTLQVPQRLSITDSHVALNWTASFRQKVTITMSLYVTTAIICQISVFSMTSRPAPEPTQWVPGVKQPGRESDHSPPYSPEVKNGGALPPPAHVFMPQGLTYLLIFNANKRRGLCNLSPIQNMTQPFKMWLMARNCVAWKKKLMQKTLTGC
jgi:hypothetical protein